MSIIIFLILSVTFSLDYFFVSEKMCNFAAMNENNWSENIIIVDADYVDSVAFDLIVNFERMLGRRIPQADLARWIVCVALDGGLRQKEPDADGTPATDGNETHVILIHDKQHQELKNFLPSNYEKELNAKAFKDHLGEFTLSALPVEPLTTKADFFIETLQLVCSQKEVKRIMVVADAEQIYNKVRQTLDKIDDDDHKRITVFVMQPMPGGAFRQEILGYSLMSALGIHSEELEEKLKG